MAEDLQEVTNVIIDTNEATPRLEHIKLPNGVSYKIGLSLEEQKSVINALSGLNYNIGEVNKDVEELKDSEQVVAASLNDLNSRIVTLTQENTSLKTEIANLKNEIEAIKKEYMTYYAVDLSRGIGENNTYSVVNG